MKKAQIYTTKGDAGETSLLRGERVAKDDARVEAYGAVDELSAWLGMLQLDAADTPFVDALSGIQNRLFAIAASLADSAPCEHYAIDEAVLASLEQAIDALEASMPHAKGFLLPSPVKASLSANMCRTVCRRAERRIVAMARMHKVPPCLMAYMNRLSDYFFLLSRSLSGGNEKIWENPCK